MAYQVTSVNDAYKELAAAIVKQAMEDYYADLIKFSGLITDRGILSQRAQNYQRGVKACTRYANHMELQRRKHNTKHNARLARVAAKQVYPGMVRLSRIEDSMACVDEKISSVKDSMKSVEKFVDSEWFLMLTDLDGQSMLHEIERRVAAA